MHKHTISAAIILGVSGCALAGPISIEPDHFASGTNISGKYKGVSLCPEFSETTGKPLSLDVWSRTAAGFATTGTRVFANNHETYADLWGGTRPNLCLIFDDFAKEISVDVISDDCGDYGYLAAFRSDDSLIARVESRLLCLGESQRLWVGTPGDDIKYVILGGKGGDAMYLDNICATLIDNPAIPLPSTAALALFGLGIVGLRRVR